MNQSITGFHKDAEDHWVAELECGHAQHVRHDPPWVEREWVITPEGRANKLGQKLNCVRCDEMGQKIAKALIIEFKKTISENYESAGISGLCEEGRFEVAINSIETINIQTILETTLKPN